MNDDSTNIFKVFRVLWFPMSLNAVALGAAAVVMVRGSWRFLFSEGNKGHGDELAWLCPSVWLRTRTRTGS